MNKLLSLCLLCTLSISGLFAQEGQSFSLKEAQEYALKNNPTIENARIDIEKAKKKIWETTAIGLPHVSASVAYTYLPTIPEMDWAFPAYGILQPDNTVALEYKSQSIALGVEQSTTIDATVSQLIFSGSYLVGLQVSKTFKKLSEQNLKLTENDIRESVSNAFYLVMILEENKAILKQSKLNIDTTLFELKEMYKEGFIEDTDVDQIQYTASTIDNAFKTITRQTEIAYNLLKFQMGMDLSTEISIQEDLTSIVEGISMESMIGGENNISGNVTYQLLQTQEKLQEASLKLEKAGFLPTIAAFYNHQEKTNKADFDFTMPDVVGINVDIPIFSSWQRMAKVKQAQLELAKTRNSKDQAIEGIKLQIQQAQITLQSAFESYVNEKSNLELSKKIYDKTLMKYKEGLSSSMELTQANSQHLTAQSNYFKAANELLQAKSKLDNLLNRN